MLGDLFDQGDEDDLDLSMSPFFVSSTDSNGSSRRKPSRTLRPPNNYDRRPAHGKVGLLNQGATCYLNSLIQMLYMTPELRQGLYSLTPESLHIKVAEKEEHIEKLLVDTNVDEPFDRVDAPATISKPRFYDELVGMGFNQKAVLNALSRHPGITDYMPALDDLLAGVDDTDDDDFMPLFEDTLPKEEIPPPPPKKPRVVPYQMQRLFAQLQHSNSKAVSTSDLTSSFGWAGSEVSQQHDVHELNRLLVDAIEMSLKGTHKETMLGDLFRGSLQHKIICTVCARVSSREDAFMDLPIVVKGFNSLEESLASMVQFEELRGDNQYYCEDCCKKVDASKGMSLIKLPPILTLPLQRFEYDWERDKRVKIQSKVEFPLILDMNPFVESSNGRQDHIYQLFAVLIHSGGAYGGHYHAFIHDVLDASSASDSNPVDDVPDFVPRSVLRGWYDFNDSNVSSIPVSAIRSMFGGKNECAYMLLYRRSHELGGGPAIPLASEVTAPAHILQEIRSINEKGETERSEYEQAINSMKLTVRTPDDYFLDDDGILKERPIPDDKESKFIQVDQRDTIDTLKSGLLDMLQSNRLSLDRMVVQEFSVRGGKIHLSQPVDGDMTLRQAGLRDGSMVLAWDGTADTILSSLQYPPINLRISFYHSSPPSDGLITPSTFTVSLPDNSPLSRLRRLVSEKLPDTLPSSVLFLCLVDPKELRPLIDDNATLSSFGVGQDSLITAEFIDCSGGDTSVEFMEQSSVGMRDCRRRRDMIEMFVINLAVTDDEERARKETIKLIIDRDITVQSMKKEILALIPVLPGVPTPSMEFTRLRKALVGGLAGPILPDEYSTVRDSGLQPGQLLIIEAGTPPGGSMLTIRFVFSSSNARNKSLDQMQHELRVSKSITVGRCKEMMLGMVNPLSIGKDQLFRLRSTDFFEMPEKLIPDESATLEASGVRDDDLLWLEPGHIIPKGHISIRFFLYGDGVRSKKKQSEAPSTLIDSPIATDETAVLVASPISNGPISHVPSAISLHLSPHFAAMPWDRFWITHLVELDFNHQTPLGEVKSKLLDSCPELAQFVQSEAVSSQRLRLWSKDRLLRGDSVSLKKLGLSDDAAVTVQVVSGDADQQLDDNPTSILLFLQKRNVAGSFFEPPIDLIFTGRSIRELRREVAERLSPDNWEKVTVVMARYVAYDKKSPWRVLPDEDVHPIEKQKGKRRNDRSGLKTKPYNFKDGEIIGVVMVEDTLDQESLTYFEQAGALAAAQIASCQPNDKRSAQSARTRAPEAVLRIKIEID